MTALAIAQRPLQLSQCFQASRYCRQALGYGSQVLHDGKPWLPTIVVTANSGYVMSYLIDRTSLRFAKKNTLPFRFWSNVCFRVPFQRLLQEINGFRHPFGECPDFDTRPAQVGLLLATDSEILERDDDCAEGACAVSALQAGHGPAFPFGCVSFEATLPFLEAVSRETRRKANFLGAPYFETFLIEHPVQSLVQQNATWLLGAQCVQCSFPCCSTGLCQVFRMGPRSA